MLVERLAGGVNLPPAAVAATPFRRSSPSGVRFLEKRRMSDPSITPPKDRFKADMPQIPGIHGALPKATRAGGAALVVAGLVAVLIAVFLGGRFLSKAQHSAPAAQPTPQIELPSALPDLTPSVPAATEQNPTIAHVGDLAKPWQALPFTFRNHMTGETVPALLLRLPSGSPADISGYWSLQMKAAFGTCQLEYVQDLAKLRSDYTYPKAKHPMVGNPCSRTLFDPLKYATLAGDVLVRGAMVQGSDLRPPLGIEIQIHGKEILATRME